MKEKNLHIRISEKLMKQLKETATEYEMSISSMVRFIIKQFTDGKMDV